MRASDIYPPVSHELPNGAPTLSIAQFIKLFSVWNSVAAFSILLIIYDWAQCLPTERRLIWKSRKGPFIYAFLLSRYTSLAWSVAILCLALAGHWTWTPKSCVFVAVAPQIFALILLSAHAVLVIRVWALWNFRKMVLFGLFGLAFSCFALEVVANLFVKAVLVGLSQTEEVQEKPVHVCFPAPTSRFMVLAFVAPAVVGQVILGLTLSKSISHIRATGSEIMKTLQRDQCFFVLAGCLADLINVVLVAMPADFNYRLLGLMPTMVVTQILLGRMVFNSKRMGEQLPALPTSAFRLTLDAGPDSPETPDLSHYSKWPSSVSTTSPGCPVPPLTPDARQTAYTTGSCASSSCANSRAFADHPYSHHTSTPTAPSRSRLNTGHRGPFGLHDPVIHLGAPSGSSLARRRSASGDVVANNTRSPVYIYTRARLLDSPSPPEDTLPEPPALDDSPMWFCRGPSVVEELPTVPATGQSFWSDRSSTPFGNSPQKAS